MFISLREKEGSNLNHLALELNEMSNATFLNNFMLQKHLLGNILSY